MCQAHPFPLCHCYRHGETETVFTSGIGIELREKKGCFIKFFPGLYLSYFSLVCASVDDMIPVAESIKFTLVYALSNLLPPQALSSVRIPALPIAALII